METYYRIVIVCGLSNCGKTNAVLALLTHPNGLRFANLYVYSISLNQLKYTLLKRMLDNAEGLQVEGGELGPGR